MSELELQSFVLRKEDNGLKADLEQLFELDLDIQPKAKKFVKELYNADEDDHTNIQVVLDFIEQSHGSFSTNFTSTITEVGEFYVVSVAYNCD